ncbi:MAG: TetR/AcrR family transcriptional regulator [Phyllobacterium sp.]
MQQATRSNRERTETTRNNLISTARALFVEKGYAETSTPEICAAAGITRGALYHHFADKRDLLRAVLEREARSVADDIEAAAPSGESAKQALISGSLAYLDAMRVAGRTRLLLVEGPAVLGIAEMQALDEAHGARTLREGIEAALKPQDLNRMPVLALSALLSAAFDRAALAIDAGGDAADFRAAMIGIIECLLGDSGR